MAKLIVLVVSILSTAAAASSTEEECVYTSCDVNSYTESQSWEEICQLGSGGCGGERILGPWVAKLTNLDTLTLVDQNLSGSLPEEICTLKNLKRLELPHNRIKGTIPECLGDLNNLESLSLENNELTGTIPETITSLTKLTDLLLPRNSLSGKIPSSWPFYASPLRRIDLGDNALTSTIPRSLFTFFGLETIKLRNNNLVGLPTVLRARQLQVFPGVSQIKTMDLFNNSISGDVFQFFEGYSSSLQFIYLGNNKIEETIPSRFGDLKDNLLRFSVRNNKIHGPIPVLENLSKLISLDMPNNHLTGSVPNWNAFTSLEYVNLGHNRLSGSLPDSYSNTLKSIQIQNNKITGPLPQMFFRGGSLAKIDVSHNRLSSQIPTVHYFSNIGSVLTDINFGDNFFESPIPRSIWVIPMLTSLTLRNNRFNSIDFPVNAPEVGSLLKLDISGNKFDGPIFEWIGRLPLLKSLYLGRNDFSGTIPQTFQNFAELSHLSLGGNKLNGTIPDFLMDLTSLELLDLSSNSLYGTIPPAIKKLQHLKYIDFGQTDLSSTIPQSIGTLHDLESLSLGFTKLSGVIPETILKLPKLNGLFIHSDYLENPFPKLLQDLTNLTQLEIGTSRLKFQMPVSIRKLTNLRTLQIKDSTLTGPIPRWINELSNLNYLILRNNSLTGPLPEEVGDLVNLTQLSIERNGFVSSLPSSLSKLTNLEFLDVGGNQFVGPGLEMVLVSEKLQFLSIERNGLTGSIPESVGNFTALTSLSMGFTDVGPEVPDSITKLTNLRALSLGGNSITRLPRDSSNILDNLDSLSLPFHSLLCDKDHLGHMGSKWIGAVADVDSLTCSNGNSYRSEPMRRLQIHSDEPGSAPSMVNSLPTPTSLLVFWAFVEVNPLEERDDLIKVRGDAIRSQLFSQPSFPCDIQFDPSYFSRSSTKEFIGTVFRVEWSDAEQPQAPWQEACTAFATYTVTNLHPFRKYRVRVAAANMWAWNTGNGPWRSIFLHGPRSIVLDTATSEFAPFDAPTKLSILNGSMSDTSFRVEWQAPKTPNSREVSYDIELFSLGLNSKLVERKVDVRRPQFDFGGLESSTAYLARVRATNSEGFGPWANLTLQTEARCPRGTVRVMKPSFACLPCEKDTFSLGSECVPCPDDFPRTSGVGAKSKNECTADKGNFFMTLEDGSRESVSCNSEGLKGKVICDEVGISVSDLTIRSSYWRISKKSLDILSCPYPEMCKSSATASNGTRILQTAGKRDDTNFRYNEGNSLGPSIFRTELGFDFNVSSVLCEEYHTGVFCQTCENGFSMKGKQCIECTDDQRAEDAGKFAGWVVLAVFVVLLFPFALVLKAIRLRSTDTPSSSDGNDGTGNGRCCNYGKLKRKLSVIRREDIDLSVVFGKIALGFFQVALSFCHTTGLLDGVSKGTLFAITNLDVSTVLGFMDTACFTTTTYYSELLVYTLMPIVILLVLFLALMVLKCFVSRPAFANLTGFASSISLLLLFFIYPALSTKVINTFIPRSFQMNFANSSEVYRTLEQDLTLWFDSERSEQWRIYAAVMIAVYPVGVVLLFSVLSRKYKLWKKRNETERSELQEALMKSFSILSERYNFEYFETIELVRKLLLTAVFTAMYRTNAAGGTVFYLVVLNLSAFLLMFTMPYQDTRALSFASISLLLLFLLGALSIFNITGTYSSLPGAASSILVFELVLFVLLIMSQFMLRLFPAFQRSPSNKAPNLDSSRESPGSVEEAQSEETLQPTSFGNVSIQVS